MDINNDNEQQQQAARNVELEDDHDEDEEEEDDGIERDADGVLDGGVAGVANQANADDSSTGAAAAARRRSSDCDLILYIVCAENMDDIAPKHSILKEGVVVSIGLDKNTKLGSVFRRFAEFCNEHSSQSAKSHHHHHHHIKVEESDLEFFHCQLLNATDTAESSALMKNDRIKVRRERAAERQAQSELKRIQRESDKEYFKQLSNLMPNTNSSSDNGDNEDCDVVFDCQGKIGHNNNDDDEDEDEWNNQKQLSTKVLGHSVTLSKRCKWLAELIEESRLENLRELRFTPYVDGAVKEEEPTSHNRIEFPAGHIVANTSSTLHEDNEESRQHSRRRANNPEEEDGSDDDDDEIGVLPYPVQNRPQAAVQLGRGGATEIEDDDNDDEDDDGTDVDSMAAVDNSRSPIVGNPSVRSVREATRSDQLVVSIPKHSPEAMKLLLEYCYTNRVISLGHDAFVQACRTKPVKPNGPVSPYSSSRRWPNNGVPQVSFAVALAGIALAEESCMRRFSLMCEVAASRLVNSSNVVDALSMCTVQQSQTGNPLPRLREVAMNVILRFGPRGVYDMPRFQKALEGRTTSIIPTLFTGTVQAIDSSDKGKTETKKRERSAIAESFFVQCDREDLFKRERERKKRRNVRDGRIDGDDGVVVKSEEDEDFYCDPVHSSSWAAESARRSLKRMSQHLSAGNFNVGRSGRDNLGSRVSFTGAARRRSRRRSSERN